MGLRCLLEHLWLHASLRQLRLALRRRLRVGDRRLRLAIRRKRDRARGQAASRLPGDGRSGGGRRRGRQAAQHRARVIVEPANAAGKLARRLPGPQTRERGERGDRQRHRARDRGMGDHDRVAGNTLEFAAQPRTPCVNDLHGRHRAGIAGRHRPRCLPLGIFFERRVCGPPGRNAEAFERERAFLQGNPENVAGPAGNRRHREVGHGLRDTRQHDGHSARLLIDEDRHRQARFRKIAERLEIRPGRRIPRGDILLSQRHHARRAEFDLVGPIPACGAISERDLHRGLLLPGKGEVEPAPWTAADRATKRGLSGAGQRRRILSPGIRRAHAPAFKTGRPSVRVALADTIHDTIHVADRVAADGNPDRCRG